eukprot:10496874-Prorocentrum_lima.AAC.1
MASEGPVAQAVAGAIAAGASKSQLLGVTAAAVRADWFARLESQQRPQDLAAQVEVQQRLEAVRPALEQQ